MFVFVTFLYWCTGVNKKKSGSKKLNKRQNNWIRLLNNTHSQHSEHSRASSQRCLWHLRFQPKLWRNETINWANLITSTCALLNCYKHVTTRVITWATINKADKLQCFVYIYSIGCCWQADILTPFVFVFLISPQDWKSTALGDFNLWGHNAITNGID